MAELIEKRVNVDDVPKEVVDLKAWKKYCLLVNSATLQQNAVIASDGTEVNLNWLPNVFRRNIAHLSAEEREDLEETYGNYKRVVLTANRLKGAAYGRMQAAYARMREQGAERREQRRLLNMSRISLQDDIIQLLGRMFTPREVVNILSESREIEVSIDTVQDVLRKNLDTIEKLREEFRTRVQDVRLYSKRPRLEELSWMFTQMKARYKALHGIDAYNAMLRTLEQIRKEAEGDQININASIDLNVEAEIQAHIRQTIYKSINLKEIILGRVAARMNWDLAKLVAGLHNSYYARFMPSNDLYDPTAEMEYPSSHNYDFNAIAQQHAATGIDEVQDVKALPVTEQEKTEAESTRELFLQRIKQQRELLEAPGKRAEAETDFWRTKLGRTADDEHVLTRAEGRAPQQRKRSNKKVKK